MNLINKLDFRIVEFVNNRFKNKAFDFIMPIITRFADYGIAWVILALILMSIDSYRLVGYEIIIALLLCLLMGEGAIKHVVKRQRPYMQNEKIKVNIRKPKSYSFPSGHTASSIAIAHVLSVYFSPLALIFYITAFLIAFSRIYLLVHYPSDVVIGALLGILCSLLALII